MRNIKIIGVIIITFISLKITAQSTQCFPNPKNSMYQYTIKLNMSVVPSNFDKTQLINYLYNSYPPSSSLFHTHIASSGKTYISTRLTNYLDHLITVFSTNGRLDTVFSNFSSKYSYFRKHCFPESMLSFQPNDFNLQPGFGKHLSYSSAISAWDKHRADSRIRIGFTDTYLDVVHEDISTNVGQIILNTLNAGTDSFHGTAVGGCLSAVTHNGVGIASIAGNARLVFSNDWGWDPEVLRVASQNRVRVVNTSWVNECSYRPDQDSFYRFIEDTLNVVVVGAAGNNERHCGPKTARNYPAALPSVICVTSVNHTNPPGFICPYVTPNRPCLIEDRHETISGDTTSSHHHYPEVDISSPGYNVTTTFYHHNGTHREYIGAYGTSFASPLVASACALVASFNPCLTAREIRQIVVQSANPSIYNITENARYNGMLGVGKLDINAALNRAEQESTTFVQNFTYPSSQTLTRFKIVAGRNVTAGAQGSVIIPNTRNIVYNVHHSVELHGGFEVNSGSAFEIRLSESPCY